MKFGYRSIGFIVALTVLSATFTSFAPKINAASSTSIFVNVSPENPAPYENTTISLSSYESNLDNVLISWSVNGKKVSSGIGKKSFSVTAAGPGVETSVVATISLPDGTTDTKVIIHPLEMVLLWQANDSYVPPFYRGKAMPTPSSEVKVVAMPEVKSGSSFVNPKNMTYAWREDYTNDQSASGYGRNYYIYLNDYLENSNDISVTAKTVDQKYSSEATINIGTTSPKISFYKSDPQIGILWDQTLSDGHQIKDSETVIAAPYFISPKNLYHPDLIFNWTINDQSVPVASYRKNAMPLKVQPGVTGESTLRLDVESVSKIFESANKEITVEF